MVRKMGVLFPSPMPFGIDGYGNFGGRPAVTNASPTRLVINSGPGEYIKVLPTPLPYRFVATSKEILSARWSFPSPTLESTLEQDLFVRLTEGNPY